MRPEELDELEDTISIAMDGSGVVAMAASLAAELSAAARREATLREKVESLPRWGCAQSTDVEDAGAPYLERHDVLALIGAALP